MKDIRELKKVSKEATNDFDPAAQMPAAAQNMKQMTSQFNPAAWSYPTVACAGRHRRSGLSQRPRSRKMHELVEDAMPEGDTLVGAIHAHQQSTFSVEFYVVGATDHHLIVLPVDKRWRAADAEAIVLRPDEIDVENLFQEGEGHMSSFLLSD